MKFEVDKQTLKDLEIFDTVKNGKSVFTLFNYTVCLGGRKKLYSFLSSPLSNLEELTERKDTIKFFQTYLSSGMDVDKNALDFTEYYLRHGNFPSRPPSRFVSIERKLLDKINPSNDFYIVEKGVISTVQLLKDIYQFSLTLAGQLKGNDYPKLLKKNNDEVLRLFSQPEYMDITKMGRIKSHDSAVLDYMFRYTHKKDILFFLNLVYEYDAFQSIAQGAKKLGLAYPEILPAAENQLDIEGLFHPFVDNAVSNDILFGGPSNLLFISGPNMAGKSTFLKALGVCVYLAHVGFPVPAQSMRLSLLSGICSTINISDNLNSGYSHFYAEVMRIKDVALKLETNNNMLVLFDELFRGTNVKDAYDGTLAVVSALAKIKTSFFVVSTHIVEVAKELNVNDNIKFCFFEIQEKDGQPSYTYKLKEGVSDVRLGMYIIKKEGLIELLNGINQKTTLI